MHYFKFVNWRIGEFVFFDIMSRLIVVIYQNNKPKIGRSGNGNLDFLCKLQYEFHTLSLMVWRMSSRSSSCFLYLSLRSFSACLMASCLSFSCSSCSSFVCPLLTNSSDVFTNLFHEFFQKIFSVWAVEKEDKLHICPKQGFFISLPVEKEIT